MRISPPGMLLTLGSSVDLSTTTWTLFFNYTAICTNFTHTAGGSTFSGNARLQGAAFLRSDGTTSFFGAGTSAPDLTLHSTSATVIIDSGTTSVGFLMGWTNVTQPFATFTVGTSSITTFDGSFAAGPLIFSASTMTGDATYEASGGGQGIGDDDVQVFLASGGTCPV